jgi:hypothetical protein
MAQGGQAGGGQVNVTTPPPRKNNTPLIVGAALAGLLLLGLILWLIFRPRDINVNVPAPIATATTQVVEVVVTPTPEPPTATPVVQTVVVAVTDTPEPPSPTPIVQTVVVVVTDTPGPPEPTATAQVVVVTTTPNPSPTSPPQPTQPPATPTTVPTLTAQESQIAAPLRQAPDGDQVTYVHYDGSNIQVYFNIAPRETLPEAALQAKQQVKDLLQQLVQVDLTYGQVTLYGSYPLPAGQGTPAAAPQAGGTVVVEATYTYDKVENTDWGSLPPEPIYEQAQSSTINPQFQEAATP